MTVLTISQDTLIQLPDGANGGTVTVTYHGTTTGPVIGSGDDQGRAVIVSGRLAKLTNVGKNAPLKVVGREAGGRMPARVTLRVYPEYPAGKSGPVAPITLSGLPVGSPDAPGIWDLSNIDDASGGLDVVTAGERQSLAVLRERTTGAAAQAEAAAGQVAVQVSRVDAGLADITQNQAQLTQQQQGNNAQAAMNIGRRSALKVALIGSAAGLYNIISDTDAGQVWERNDDGTTARRPDLEAAAALSLAAQTARLQFGTLADLNSATGLTAGQTVIVQNGQRGGMFVIGTLGTHDNTITYALDDGLFAHRVWDGTTVRASWAGVHRDATGQINSDGMQQALDTANARAARIVEIGGGTFSWAHECRTYANIWIRGAGETKLKANSDIRFFFLARKNAGEAGYLGVRVSDLVLARDVFPTRTWEIDFPDCIRATLERVRFETWQSPSDRTAVSGARLQATSGVTSFMATIIDCWTNGGSLWIEQSDSRVQGGYYWGHNREFAIRIKDTAAVSVTNADVVPSPVHGGIWGDQSYGITVTSDMRGDGSYDGVATGWTVNLEGGHSHQVAGDFYQALRGGIRFKGVSTSVIHASPHREGNRVNDPAYRGGAVEGDGLAYPDILLEDSTDCMVYLGSHIISKSRGKVAPAVKETGASARNTYMGGQIRGTYTSPEIVLVAGGGSTIIGGRGLGGRKLGVASGIATFPAGAADRYLVVQHGLGNLPERANVVLTPQNNFGAVRYWLDNLDADNLVLYVSDTPTSDLKLGWRVTLD
ncbi:hypothetical protein [Deinococcus sp. Leaf326]|uniref:hypothetical protein n=1 Tax=Deinococcus sp. Leaf326 TaxID=1736338 RepID=UPI0006F23050|nr:hypothetical protein [Deinococcus sp. Leaf326]KQR23028.1 hypothetical protein ASF71_07710 [Deinococcus sp. Leaf326]